MAYDWYPQKWWTLERSQIEVNCTDNDLTKFIERALSFQWRPVADDANATTDAGKVKKKVVTIASITIPKNHSFYKLLSYTCTFH